MEIPKRFQVAGHEYSVERSNLVYNQEGESIFGEHNPIRCKIFLAEAALDAGEVVGLSDHQIRNTFWHEVFHAFNFYWNNEQDEELAQSFANFMCEFEYTKQ